MYFIWEKQGIWGIGEDLELLEELEIMFIYFSGTAVLTVYFRSTEIPKNELFPTIEPFFATSLPE